jgi:hypothetical protein
VISSQGSLTVAGSKLQVGHAHRGKIVTVAIVKHHLKPIRASIN